MVLVCSFILEMKGWLLVQAGQSKLWFGLHAVFILILASSQYPIFQQGAMHLDCWGDEVDWQSLDNGTLTWLRFSFRAAWKTYFGVNFKGRMITSEFFWGRFVNLWLGYISKEIMRQRKYEMPSQGVGAPCSPKRATLQLPVITTWKLATHMKT